MRVSRSDRRAGRPASRPTGPPGGDRPGGRGAGGARLRRLLLIAALLPTPAVGQQLGPPIPLVPQPPPGERPEAPVASEKLSPPAPGWGGHMAVPTDALPSDFWRGTPRTVAELLLAHLPETASPALQAIERRLLLSPGAAPQGPDLAGHNLPTLRAAALLRLGETDAARAVVAAVPEPERGAALPLAVAADAIAGDIDRACATVRDRIRRDQSAYWQQSLIACQALQGEAGEARLGMQLLAEQKVAHDETLALALETSAGRAAPAVVRLHNPEPLTLRLLVKAHRRLAPALVDALSPELALTLALDATTPAATRLAAAERAARFGALKPARLAALYGKLAAVAGNARDDPSLARARRFAAIADAADAGDRLAKSLAFADAFGAEPGRRFLAARLVAPALRQIEPDPGVAASAGAAARLLLAAGDVAAARRWAAMAPEKDQPGLRRLLRLATPGNAAPVEPVAERGAAPSQMLAAALFAALGEPTAVTQLPSAAWSAVARPAVPSAAWLDLAEAAAAKRIGETLLAAASVAAPNGNLTTDPVILAAALSGIERVGCDDDARRLAVEAALAAGL
jgi:hypothetical protein